MTQKEINIINAINREGLDNSMWGIYGGEFIPDRMIDSRVLYGTVDHIKVPPHIYIYRDNESDKGMTVKGFPPDRTVEDENGQIIDLYYLHNEELIFKESEIRKWAGEYKLNADVVLAQLCGFSFHNYLKGGER